MRVRKFGKLGLMADCSRNAAMNIPTVKKLIGILEKLGYNSLMLYTEDTYETDNEPFFGYMRARYSKDELKELDSYARRHGIELIPCIQTLAHLNQIFRWKEYQPINDVEDILLAGEKRTYILIENMIKSCAEVFGSRTINIGMDEAAMLGLGKYLKKNGYEKSLGILNRHLNEVRGICAKYGFKPLMWSDMFFRTAYGGEYYNSNGDMHDDCTGIVPEDTDIIYWDYSSTDKNHYDNMFRKHKSLFKNPDAERLHFACGAWKWSGFAPDNTYSLETQKNGLLSAYENNVDSVIVTVWGDNGAECSIFAALPGIVNAAAYNSGRDVKELFKEVTGEDFDSFMLLDKLNRINAEMKPDELNNFSKCYLYSDPFNGFFDSNVEKGLNEKYAALSKEISKAALRVKDGQDGYRYIFDTLAHLAAVLACKAELGVLLRNCYQSGDKAGLKKLAESMQKTVGLLEAFYERFRFQWYKENKQCGFDVQDLRIGGLIMRLKNCKRLVSDYLDGNIIKLEELEVKLLDFSNGLYGNKKSNSWYHNEWRTNVTSNIL